MSYCKDTMAMTVYKKQRIDQEDWRDTLDRNGRDLQRRTSSIFDDDLLLFLKREITIDIEKQLERVIREEKYHSWGIIPIKTRFDKWFWGGGFS